jgi:hypothetical protein
MRSTFGAASVRLYWLDEGNPVAETLFYGPLGEALAIAADHPDPDGLWIATDNDVVPYIDLADG